MDVAAVVRETYALGPRIPPLRLRNRDTMEPPSRIMGGRGPSKVLLRDTSTNTDPCAAKDAPANLCEKPASSQSSALPISLGVM
ncbi:MAG: hypothetical protein JWP34_4848 [Massilia sp.]|nr:hypothetical protein [Massilia sp.]